MPVQAETLFEVFFPALLHEKRTIARKVDGVVMFTVVGKKGGSWSLDLRKKGTGRVHVGVAKAPDLRIIVAEDFLEAFVSGKYEPETAFKNGKLGVAGDQDVYGRFVALLVGQTPQTANKAGSLKEPKKKGVSLR